jgi:hypothetical protein
MVQRYQPFGITTHSSWDRLLGCKDAEREYRSGIRMMNEATQEGLDCETSSSYKGMSFRPCFMLLWTNWLFSTVTGSELRRSLIGVVSSLYLLCSHIFNSIYQNKSYQLSAPLSEAVNHNVFARVISEICGYHHIIRHLRGPTSS